MENPADLRYTASHEWLRDNGDGTATVGITFHAQDALGELVYVELPAVGRSVTAGEACVSCCSSTTCARPCCVRK